MQRISALLTVFKMFEIRCSPLRTLRDLFRQADAGPPGSAHGKVAAELGHIVAGGVIRQEHAHNAEVGLKEGKLGLGRGLRGLLGPLRLSQFLFGRLNGGAPLVRALKPQLHQTVELAPHHVVVDPAGQEAGDLRAILEICLLYTSPSPRDA